jgi:hypothetical protein
VKRGPAARIILTLVFTGLVISPIFIKRYASRHNEAKARLDVQTALARHGFYCRRCLTPPE